MTVEQLKHFFQMNHCTKETMQKLISRSWSTVEGDSKFSFANFVLDMSLQETSVPTHRNKYVFRKKNFCHSSPEHSFLIFFVEQNIFFFRFCKIWIEIRPVVHAFGNQSKYWMKKNCVYLLKLFEWMFGCCCKTY
jgi:hypothetical protein